MMKKVYFLTIIFSLLFCNSLLAKDIRVETEGKCGWNKPLVKKIYDEDRLIEYHRYSYKDCSPTTELYCRDGVCGGIMHAAEVHDKEIYNKFIRITPQLAKIELEIIGLKDKYYKTRDEAIKRKLLKAKEEAVSLYLNEKDLFVFRYSKSGEVVPLAREDAGSFGSRAGIYARDLYEGYLGGYVIENKETLKTILELNHHTPTSDYLGDEAYLKFPLDVSLLGKQRVIVKTNGSEGIVKVYFYNKSGDLRRICMPQKETVLFIDRYPSSGGCDLGTMRHGRFSVNNIWGGKFDDFSLDYPGGAGFADMAVHDAGMKEVAQVTRNSLTQLRKALKEYQTRSGRRLTAEEFSMPIGLKHPLMSVGNMNLEYFFDGHGARILYQKGTGNDFIVTSRYERSDLQGARGARSSQWGLSLIFMLPLFLFPVSIFVIIYVLVVIFSLKKVDSTVPASIRFIGRLYGPLGIVSSFESIFVIPIPFLFFYSPIIAICLIILCFLIGRGLLRLIPKYRSLAIGLSFVFLIVNLVKTIRMIFPFHKEYFIFSFVLALLSIYPLLALGFYIFSLTVLLKSSTRLLFKQQK